MEASMATKFNMPDEFIHGVSNPGKACADPTRKRSTPDHRAGTWALCEGAQQSN